MHRAAYDHNVQGLVRPKITFDGTLVNLSSGEVCMYCPDSCTAVKHGRQTVLILTGTWVFRPTSTKTLIPACWTTMSDYLAFRLWWLEEIRRTRRMALHTTYQDRHLCRPARKCTLYRGTNARTGVTQVAALRLRPRPIAARQPASMGGSTLDQCRMGLAFRFGGPAISRLTPELTATLLVETMLRTANSVGAGTIAHE